MIMTVQEFDKLMGELGAMEFTEPVEEVKKKAEKIISTSTEEKTAPKKKKAKSAINDSELNMMFTDIKATFTGSFKNKDLGSLLDKWGLSARQTPSRLKKLVEAGLLSDLGGSPKSYQVA